MCGIAGIATSGGLRPDDRALVDAMLEVLAHRGPDDQFAHGDGHAIIGARRLSIIDLDTGRQPISTEDGRTWATQNGEIYNFVELRQELEARGHRLSTRGDTETIVHLYEDEGWRFVERLRGMFALALWDGQRRRLILARDRLGKKPLYWRLDGGRLSYGSELKALLCDTAAPRIVDREALGLYLAYQYVPAPRSILTGVHKLAPASVLTWDGGEPLIERYWTPSYEPKDDRPPAEQREACLELLRESVRLRLRSDVPVGLFLSGGMDSSVIAALMAEASSGPIRTFTIGFEEREYDERPYARAVAQAVGAHHTEEIVRLDAIDLLPELAEHYDEPFGDSSAIPTFRIAQLASRELKVVLTGDGGDEVFGGYERYRLQLGRRGPTGLPAPVQRLLADTARLVLARTAPRSRLRRRVETWRRIIDLDADQRYLSFMSIFPRDLRTALFGVGAADPDRYLLDVIAAGPTDPVDRMLWTDTSTYLPEDLLVKMDRATMANSLEARAPLLDHHLVEFAAHLPSARKIRNGTTKVILREIARGLLPAHLVDRPKKGFGVPVDRWFRDALGDRYRDLVLTPDARLRDHLDQSLARNLLDEHRSGKTDHAHRLWLLLMFELWARRWLGSGDGTSG